MTEPKPLYAANKVSAGCKYYMLKGMTNVYMQMGIESIKMVLR